MTRRPILRSARSLRSLWAPAAVLVLLAACSNPADNPGGPAGNTETASNAETLEQPSMTNPVYDTNFPDPQIVATDTGWLAVATNGNGRNVQTATSDDLVTWEQGDDALPTLPDWSMPGKVWAPEIIELDENRWAMYYTTIAPNPEIQCIGVAFADRPEGPYVDDSDAPLVCEQDQGGSIDASPFLAADGHAYLYWKNDGNAVGVDTWISVQELTADGSALQGEPHQLLRQDLPWEGRLIEAPFVVERDGRFHLFYSANDYGSADYAVGHAVGSSALGPFTKDSAPVLVSNDVAAGPGHCAVFADGDQFWMVYHAWRPDGIGDDAAGRSMWLSRMTFDDGGSVTVDPPAVRPK